MHLSEILRKIGFNENKSKVYLACLELGSASASKIAGKAKVVRTTTYKILDELVDQGLLEVDAKVKTKTFKAQNPKKLVKLLDQQKDILSSSLLDFTNIFLETKFKPKLRFYEGENGIKQVFEDILNYENITVKTFSPMQNVIQLFGKTYTSHFTDKRAKKNILRKALRQKSDQKHESKLWEFYSTDKMLLREVKFLPEDITFNPLIQVYDNKVSVISSEKEHFAFIVESEELATFMEKIFDLLWRLSSKN